MKFFYGLKKEICTMLFSAIFLNTEQVLTLIIKSVNWTFKSAKTTKQYSKQQRLFVICNYSLSN